MDMAEMGFLRFLLAVSSGVILEIRRNPLRKFEGYNKKCVLVLFFQTVLVVSVSL